MKIGDKIKILREIKNISTKQMADELDMSLSGYLKIERGEVDINTEKLSKIASNLNVNPEDLLSFNGSIIKDITLHNSSGAFNHGQLSYHFPDEMKQLYEDKIKLLEDKIAYQQEIIENLKKK
jgi:transcriptional regulator with XRE-family HTH domain